MLYLFSLKGCDFLINILLNGYRGKMGKAVINHINKCSSDFNILYKIDKDNVTLYDDLLIKPDVIIDFSTPCSTFVALEYAVENLVPIVIATTGFNSMEENKIKEYSEAIPIFKSSNMSYGISIFSNLAAMLAEKLDNVDIEIVEKHHRNKADAPSGTALMIADKINKKTNNKYTYVYNRIAQSRNTYNEIGFSSIRGGNLVGEHTVLYLGENETLEITHTAHSRNIYVEGALHAAKFIITKKNGLYSMEDLV